MKRSPELRDLSVQHRDGLIAARSLRRAAEGLGPLDAAILQFVGTWRREIQPHFRQEEEVLLPAFARVAAADDPLIVRALTEHVGLRCAVRQLERTEGEARQGLAETIGRTLAEHIRFEERVLFPAIEAALAGPPLAELGRELKETGRG